MGNITIQSCRMKLLPLVLSAVKADTLVTITDKVDGFDLSRYNIENGAIQGGTIKKALGVSVMNNDWCSAIVNKELYIINNWPVLYKFTGCEFVAQNLGPYSGGDTLCGMYKDNDTGPEELLFCIEGNCRLWDPVATNGVAWGSDKTTAFAKPTNTHKGGKLIMNGVGGRPTLSGGEVGENGHPDAYVEVYNSTSKAWEYKQESAGMLQSNLADKDLFASITMKEFPEHNGKWMMAQTAKSSGDGSSLWIQAHEFSETNGNTLKSYHWDLDTMAIEDYQWAPAMPKMREDVAAHPGYKFHPMQFDVASSKNTVVFHRTHNCQGKEQATYSTAYQAYKDMLNIGDPNPYNDEFFAKCINNDTNPFVSYNEVESWEFTGAFWRGPSFHFSSPVIGVMSHRAFTMSFWESELD